MLKIINRKKLDIIKNCLYNNRNFKSQQQVCLTLRCYSANISNENNDSKINIMKNNKINNKAKLKDMREIISFSTISRVSQSCSNHTK